MRRLGELKTMCVRERQHDVILGGRRLQLEIEGAAEALAQRQAPRPVDAAAERRMNDELHAAGLIEESLEHNGVQGGQSAQGRLPGAQVLHDLKRRRFIEPYRLR